MSVGRQRSGPLSVSRVGSVLHVALALVCVASPMACDTPDDSPSAVGVSKCSRSIKVGLVHSGDQIAVHVDEASASESCEVT